MIMKKMIGRNKKKEANIGMVVACVVLIILGNGCLLTSMLGGAESPRPKEYQVVASKEIVNSNVPVVVGAQTNKQDNINLVAIKALEIIGTVSTPEQAEAITNVAANAFRAIEKANGTADIVGSMMERGNSDVLTMSTLQYAAYAAGQTAVAMRNQEAVYKGIKAGWQWTTSTIASVAGGTTGVGGLLAFALSAYRKMRSKDRLLKSTGNVIDVYSAAQPDGGVGLKTILAKAAAKLPVNAKEEFGI